MRVVVIWGGANCDVGFFSLHGSSDNDTQDNVVYTVEP